MPVNIDWLWVGIRTKESADPPAANGLRAPAKVEIRAWYDARLRAGRYLSFESRLLLITDVRDFTGLRSEVVITASELVGQPAELRVAGQPPDCCRVFLSHQAPYRDDLGQTTSYKTRAEVALIEAGRVQVDDQMLVGGVLYNVIAYADDTDDGVVRGLWLDQVA
ncbi:hypothetical protein D9M70_428020 [compost metagenome]